MPTARQPTTEQLQRTQPHHRGARGQPFTPTPRAVHAELRPPGDSMIGRIPVLDVRPLVDCGRRPAKAVAGETFEVSATVFREGHDAVAANVVLHDANGRPGPWTPMRELAPGTDRWGADVTPGSEGSWTYTVEAWSDPVTTWRRHAQIKIPAGIDTALVLDEGAELYARAAEGVPKTDGREAVLAAVDALRDTSRPAASRLAAALTAEVDEALGRHPLRELVTASRPMPLTVERRRALYGSWYELFPRSEGARQEPVAPPKPARRPRPPPPGSGLPRSRPRSRSRPPGWSAAPSARPPSGFPPSPRWGSTSSICHRSTPSAPPTARAPTTASRRERTTRVCPGRSGRPRAATTPSIPTSGRCRTSTTSSRSPAPCGWRSRWTSPCSAPRTTPG